MTKAEAIERCGKAVLRKQGYNNPSLDQYPGAREKAEDVVICLIELGLLHLEGK
jgi:hypothetical protein